MKKLIVVLASYILTMVPVVARDMALPVVPDSLRTPTERAAYVADHFWDSMDWRDTTFTCDDEFLEQSAANFYSVVNLLDSLPASKAIGSMLDAASVDMTAYRKIADISRSYLFDPESQVADDETYLALADRLIADGKLGNTDMLRIADAKRMAMLNRVGCPSTDFEYVDREGHRSTLSEALQRHPENILVFYDPDCHVCAELEERLMSADLGDTGVIMISPYGEQDGLWAQHAATMPTGWIVGRPVSDDFEDDELYDLRSTPTVLIIDSRGIVISKPPHHSVP